MSGLDLAPGRTPQLYAVDDRLRRLHAASRQRRRLREHAYTIDPGMALARAVCDRERDPKAWHAEHAAVTSVTYVAEVVDFFGDLAVATAIDRTMPVETVGFAPPTGPSRIPDGWPR